MGTDTTKQPSPHTAAESLAIFEEVLPRLTRGGARWYLWWSQDKRTAWYTVGQRPPDLTGQRDVFFGVHPIADLPDDAYTRSTRGTVATVAAVNALYADLDGKAFDAADPRGRGLQLAYAHIAQWPLAPSLLVLSGGGYHGYWLLRDTLTLATQEERRRAAQRQAAWVQRVGSDPGCKDLARVMRVPGTINGKAAYPDAPAALVLVWHPERTYTLDELQAVLGQEGSAPPSAVQGARQALLQRLLAPLTRGDCPDAQWPDPSGDYWPLCPFHEDAHTGSFSVGPKGYYCFACGAGGDLEALAGRLLDEAPVHQGQETSGDTPERVFADSPLQAYATAKDLEVERLRDYGLRDCTYQGRRALAIPYLNQAGEQVATRYRLGLHGKDRFRWSRHAHLVPYGLWKLAEGDPYIILVEGESDCHTLWHYGLPALGIPGGGVWKPDWAPYLQGKQVYVWQEPDQGGRLLVQAVGLTLPEARILVAPADRKDVSACHLHGDDVPVLLARLMQEARACHDLAAERTAQQAEEARKQAEALLACPDILGRFEALCHAMGVVGEGRNARLVYLALVTRLLPEPVSLVIKGPSSGGKSFLLKVVLQAYPEGAYLDFTAMSDHALVYDERPVAHRFIVLYEASGMGQEKPGEVNNLAYMIRSLLSEGRIRYTTVERTDAGQRARDIAREGPTGLLTTTTRSSLHPENETRMFSLTVRDDREQTRVILLALADHASGQQATPPDLGPWHALQTYLEFGGVREVVIPYAQALAARVNPLAVRMRRDFGRVLALIMAHALLHQASRARDAHGRVVATLEDYQAVYDLVVDLVAEGVEATVSPTVRATVEAVAALQREGDGGVGMRDLAENLGLDRSAASRRVRSAIDLGYLENLEDKRGRPARLKVAAPLPEQGAVLPAPADLAGRDPS
ncbi:MAG: CHC2 zinc finger domain-containing protein [Anaerolineae bacterium]